MGSQGGVFDRVVMGATGEGLAENVREAYSFISNNYSPGDEIFLVGFSRGAYTVRAVAGLIGEVGLLTKKALSTLPEVFRDVQHRRDPNYRPKNPDVPFPDKPSAGSPRYVDELVRRGMTDMNVRIKAIGVWETVGSLGLPRIDPLVKLGLQTSQSKAMGFYDTKLGPRIENAFQALALDERRTAFSPAVWERPRGIETTLRQVWFPGVHSNVGGGYDDQELANITLAWMMAQLSPFLDMFPDYIMEQEEENDYYYKSRRMRRRPWSFGKLYNSSTGVYAIGGGTTRTPGQYFAIDPDTGRETDRPLRDTCEYVHPSVRTRIRLHGPGKDDKGDYEPPAMDDWRLVIEYPPGPAPPSRPPGPGMEDTRPKPNIYWRARFEDPNVSTMVLPEAPLWAMERRLLRMDPKTEEYVLYPPETKGGRGRTEKEGRGQRRMQEERKLDAEERKIRRRSHIEGEASSIIDDRRSDRDDRRSRRRSTLGVPSAEDDRRSRRSSRMNGGPPDDTRSRRSRRDDVSQLSGYGS